MTPHRRAALELAAVALSLLLRWACLGTAWEKPLLLALALAWTGYLLGRLALARGTWREWGLGREALGAGLLWHGLALVATLAAVVGLAALLGLHHRLDLSAANLALYVAWALVQEAVLQNVLAAGFTGVGVPHRWVPLVAAVAFGAAHLPDVELASLALVGGFLWVLLFRRARNLWTLSASHAVTGAVALGLLFGRNPADSFTPWLVRLFS